MMAADVPLNWFLYFAAAAFGIGLFGVLVRRNAIAVLMAIEIMLNAANINFVAFWRYGRSADPAAADQMAGVMIALFVIAIAAAEVAVGIGLVLLCYRRWQAADVDQFNGMSG